MKFKKDNLGFIPVGGSEQIGMNANLYQFNDQWILVDLGIAFPDETQIGVDIPVSYTHLRAHETS